MKLSKILAAAFVLALPMFVSCTQETLSVDYDEIEFEGIGVSYDINILSGNGNYNAMTSNAEVVLASVSGDVVSLTAVGEGEAQVTVTDAANQSVVIYVSVVPALSDALAFTLGHPGSTANPESKFGIKYNQNTDAKTAQFKAIVTGTFVILNEDSFKAIDTRGKLAEAYNNGSKVNEFKIQSDANFKPVYFIVKDGDIIRLIEMTELKFEAGKNVASFKERH